MAAANIGTAQLLLAAFRGDAALKLNVSPRPTNNLGVVRGAAAAAGRRRGGGGTAAGLWQGRCQGVGVGASVRWRQSGVGGGGALAVALVPPLTLILCSVCVSRLGLSRLAWFESLGLLCLDRARAAHWHWGIVGAPSAALLCSIRWGGDSGARFAWIALGLG